jgi:hypothetical protein
VGGRGKRDRERERERKKDSHSFLGDTIGCALDGETGQVDFYINGKHLGVAMTGLGKGEAYNPEDRFYFPKVEIGGNFKRQRLI